MFNPVYFVWCVHWLLARYIVSIGNFKLNVFDSIDGMTSKRELFVDSKIWPPISWLFLWYKFFQLLEVDCKEHLSFNIWMERRGLTCENLAHRVGQWNNICLCWQSKCSLALFLPASKRNGKAIMKNVSLMLWFGQHFLRLVNCSCVYRWWPRVQTCTKSICRSSICRFAFPNMIVALRPRSEFVLDSYCYLWLVVKGMP